MIQKGLFVSHRGQSLCCTNKDKHEDISPKDFWNGEIRKTALDNMNQNKPVKGCDSCYYNEKNRIPSERTTYNRVNHVPTKKLPTLLDIDFSNFCNLKCIMCGSSRSSQWAKDEGKGVSAIDTKKIDDLIDISDELQEVTIQGGEPSIMKEFEYYFTALQEKDVCKNINLQIITNLTNTNKNFLKLFENFKSVRLGISVDSFGLANDYIRWPSKFNAIEKNIGIVSEIDTITHIDILNSINILSLFNYGEFLTWAKRMEKVCTKKDRYFGVTASVVDYPRHLNPFIAPLPLKEKFVTDTKKWFDKNNFELNTKFKIEISMIMKKLANTEENKYALKLCKQTIAGLDTQRQVKVNNFIPEYHKYM